jgi:hypothetical protein
MLAQVAPSLNPFVQLPVTASTHAAVLLPAVRVHVADGGLPSPKHDAAQVAPTVLLRQPAIQTALLMGMLLAVGTPGQVTARQGRGTTAANFCELLATLQRMWMCGSSDFLATGLPVLLGGEAGSFMKTPA